MGKQNNRYYIIYKPYNVLSQFTKEVATHVTLKDTFPKLPDDVYPVGRLDADSEGLLILTNDNFLKHQVLSPDKNTRKTYLAQVEGLADRQGLEKLKSGLKIRINKKDHFVKAHSISIVTQEPELPDRNPPIRERKAIPTSWVRVTLTEGKNRQVRRMLAGIGFPVLRLVREKIEGIHVDRVLEKPCMDMTKEEIYKLVGLKAQ